MALQLVLGSSGSGKSYEIYHRIIQESSEYPDKKYLVIVPEQFTMETQKDFVYMHPRQGIMNIDILSFMRLAYRIFDETGGIGQPVLDDMGKNMIVRRILREKKEELHYFNANTGKNGFIEEMKSFLSELLQYGISGQKLEDMIQSMEKRPVLREKLKDVRVVYEGFREYLENRYITSEELLDVLYKKMDGSKCIQDSIICLDGFTGFTPVQYDIIRKLVRYAKMVYITVTVDQREDISRTGAEYKLFHLSCQTIRRLYDIANEEGVDIKEPIYPKLVHKVPCRFKESEPLAALEHNLFRYPWTSYQKEQSDIQVFALKNPREEVAFTVQMIQKLIREKKLRYRDIAVISGDVEGFGRLVSDAFERADIPFFLDSKRSINANPAVLLIRGMLTMIEKNFDYESVFHYLRTGMTVLEREEIDRLENYVIAVGIRGYKNYAKDFTRMYGTMTEEQLEQLNGIRRSFMLPLEKVREVLRKKNRVAVFAKALYEYIAEQELFGKLEKQSKEFERQGKPLIAKEYSQVYESVMKTLETLTELLGEEVVTVAEFRELLDTGLKEARVGLIPYGVDYVLVGDMERTRLKDIKVLFFIGVNDGVVPKKGSKGEIISDMERRILRESKFDIAMSEREKTYVEQFYLYLTLTKPKNKLYLTYSQSSGEGKPLKPSYLIAKLKQLFPLMKTVVYEEETVTCDKMLGADKGMAYLLAGIRTYGERAQKDEMWEQLYSWYYSDDAFRKKLYQYVDAAYAISDKSAIDKAVAVVLYGEELTGSISRLEQYAACAFAHFVRYGLCLREREEFKIQIPDMGNIFHNVLEQFSKRVWESHLDWTALEKEEQEQICRECVDAVAESYGNGILYDTKRNEYMIERIRRIAERTVWAVAEQLKAGEFVPRAFEISFFGRQDLKAVHLELDEQKEMHLRGRIDRIDAYEDENRIYVKVLDYKSGVKKFDVVDFYYGLQLQLVVYMDVALEQFRKNHPDKEVKPAGMFYYHIDDPVIEATGEDWEKALLKELRLTGLVSEEKDIIRKLDKEFISEQEEGLNGSVKSTVIPVETVKSGDFSKTSSVVPETYFYKMISYAREKMQEFGREMLEGNTERNPYRLGERTACEYCEYRTVCAFDRKMPDSRYRILEKKASDEVWERIWNEDSKMEE